MARIIAVVGDPNSGKSVFLRLLYDELAKRNVKVLSQEADIFAPTQGWSLSPNGSHIRKELKRSFEFEKRLKWILKSLEGLRSNFDGIVLADVGGGRPDLGIRVTDENKEILSRCTHVIIVSRDEESINAWKKELAEKVPHVKVLIALRSIYNPEGKYNFDEKGVIWHLDRTAYFNKLIPEPTLKLISNLVDEVILG